MANNYSANSQYPNFQLQGSSSSPQNTNITYGNANCSGSAWGQVGTMSMSTTGITVSYSSTGTYKEKWPDIEGSIGLFFIRGDKMMIRLDDGEEQEVADLNDIGATISSLLAIAAKKSLQRT